MHHLILAAANDVGPISVPQSPAERWFYLATTAVLTLAGIAANVIISRSTRTKVTAVQDTLESTPTATAFASTVHTSLALMQQSLTTVAADVAEMRQEAAADREQLHNHIGDHARANVLKTQQRRR